MESSSFPTYSTTLLYSVAAVTAALFYVILFQRWRCRRGISLPPGPAGLPVVGSLPFLDPELHTYFARLARVYGPIFSLRLGGKLGVVISSPAIAREVLKDQRYDLRYLTLGPHIRQPRRSCCRARNRLRRGRHRLEPNGPTWRMLRRVCVREMLSPAGLDAVYGLRRREVRSTISHLYTRSGSPIDVGAQMFLTVMNVITSTLWGGTVEAADERSVVGREFRELVAEITDLLGRPNVSDFFPALARFDLQGIQKQMGVLLGRFDRIFADIIEQRRQQGAEKKDKDFLEFMLQLEAEGAIARPRSP
uniref:Uncharacterized protein n=1 Tax=Ananas comosus var. bracteatus TaxID=296719 RepID=A0A6V7NS67_ANACO|nr:unnamed protein product [Ananas comosus var. bracteatus]